MCSNFSRRAICGGIPWASFLALAVTLEDMGRKTNNDNALILAEALNIANSHYLSSGKTPSRKVNELDNRGSHFYLALYWAEALATQDKNPDLQGHICLPGPTAQGQ